MTEEREVERCSKCKRPLQGPLRYSKTVEPDGSVLCEKCLYESKGLKWSPAKEIKIKGLKQEV